jgi:hypothetical protein
MQPADFSLQASLSAFRFQLPRAAEGLAESWKLTAQLKAGS